MMQATQEQLANLLSPCLESIGRLGTPVYLDAPSKGVAEVDAWDEGPAVIVHPEQEWGMWLVRSIATGHTTTVPESYVSVMLGDATGRAHVAWAMGYSSVDDAIESNRKASMVDVWIRPLLEEMNALMPTKTRKRLPDGTPWFKAEALRLIALHVLGTQEVPSGTEKVPAGPEQSSGGV